MSAESGENLTGAAETTSATSLEVAGEPGVYWCARHRKTKTRLRCGRCETPVCPRCTVYGPTGARCRDCASNRGSHMYQIAPPQYAAAIATALALGFALGAVAAVAGLFALFYAPVAGTLMAKAVSFSTKNKRGTTLAVIAAAGLIIGAIPFGLGGLLSLLSVASSPAATPLMFPWRPILMLIYLALAVPSAWWWLK